jgi:hypothetical protein
MSHEIVFHIERKKFAVTYYRISMTVGTKVLQ